MTLRFRARTAVSSVFITLLLASSGAAQQAAPPDTYELFSAAYASSDPDRVAAIYADDAVYLPPAGEILRGRVAIRKQFADAFKGDRAGGHQRRIGFEILRRVGDGAVRTDVGYYTITVTAGGQAHSFRGKFAKTWRKGQDGTWHIQVDAFSPAPAS